MRIFVVRNWSVTSSFLLLCSLALFVLSGILNNLYQSQVSSQQSLTTTSLRLSAESIQFGAFKECVKYHRHDSTAGVDSNAVNKDYCSWIDMNCRITDDTGADLDAFCPDGFFCNNDSKASTMLCNQFNAFRALMIFAVVTGLIAMVLMMLSMCTMGRCSNGFAVAMALLAGLAGAASMALFLNLAQNEGLFAVKGLSNYQYGFWLLVAAWPCAILGVFTFLPKVKVQVREVRDIV